MKFAVTFKSNAKNVIERGVIAKPLGNFKVWFVAGSRAELDGNPLSGGELTRRVPGLIDHDVYLCGPPGLTAAVTRELLSAGVRRRQIHRESFEF